VGDPRVINWVSPSAVARLQACGLAESRRRGQARGARPSNPVARLGNAAHRVLEWIAQSAPELRDHEDAESSIADRWLEEVDREVAASQSNPLERSYGPAERWPAYGSIAAGVRVDGAALAQELAELPPERRLPETEVASSDGTIRGTADLIVIRADGTAVVIDHKAGEVSDDDVALDGRYEQQVLLYVAMARDAGLAPTRAEIRPLGRAAKPVEVSDARVTAVVAEAHAEMAHYNEAVVNDRAVDLAKPSESSCGWCPYILDCPAIWAGPPPDLGEFTVLEGAVETVQVLGSSLALRLTAEHGGVVVTGVPTTDIRGRTPSAGDNVRVTGLRQVTPDRMRSHTGRVRMSVL
jgi:hypothetical protein